MPNGSIAFARRTGDYEDHAKLMLEEPAWAEVARISETLDTLAEAGVASSDAHYAVVNERRERLSDAKANMANRERTYTASGHQMSERERAALQADIDRKARGFRDATSEHKPIKAATQGLSAIQRSVAAYLNGCAVIGLNAPTMVPAEPFAGDPQQAIAACAAEENADFDQLNAIRSAPGRREDVERSLIGQLDEMMAKETMHISFGPGRPKLSLPRRVVNAVGADGGDIPTVADVSALALRANRDALVVEIKTRVARHYEGVNLALSEGEKQRAIADIEARILARQRREAATIWAARERGQSIPFRRTMSPEAVLGMTGGPKVKLARNNVLDL